MFWKTLCPSTSVEILVLVLSVLFTGSANCNPRDTEQSSIFVRLYNEILSQIDISTYQIKDSIGTRQIFQGYLIMNTFKANQLAPFASYGFLPQAIRLAQSLRYNVESKILEPVELEVRRRIWWHLVYLDVESIIANGLTPIIRYNGYIIKMPSLTHDYKSPSDMGSTSLESFSSMMVAVQGHYQWAHHMQKWFENLPTQDEVSHFKALMETMQALLPKDNTYENIWARSYLKMQIDRAYCMLGLRFWHLDRFTGTECHSEVVEYVELSLF
jgi:Fungal specific transcription factor domain